MSAWTREAPTVGCWYWFKYRSVPRLAHRSPICQRYRGGDGGSVVLRPWDVTEDDLSMFAEWSGPIHPPGEEEAQPQ